MMKRLLCVLFACLFCAELLLIAGIRGHKTIYATETLAAFKPGTGGSFDTADIRLVLTSEKGAKDYKAPLHGDECSGRCGNEECNSECAKNCGGCNQSACRPDDKCPGNCGRDQCDWHCVEECGACNRSACRGARCEGGCARNWDNCKALCGGNCGGCDHGHCGENGSTSCKRCTVSASHQMTGAPTRKRRWASGSRI